MGALPTNPGGATLSDIYPAYVSYAHASMLLGASSVDPSDLSAVGEGTNPYNAFNFFQQLVGENVYINAEAHDPTTDLLISSEAIDALSTLVATYLTSTPSTTGEMKTVEQFVAKARELFDTYNIDIDNDISDEVDIFERNSQDTYARRRNDFEGPMFDINAIESTTYIQGLALIAGERARTVDDLRVRLTAAGRQTRNAFMLQLADLMVQLQTRNAGLYQAIASLRDGHARWSYTSKREQAMQDVEYDLGEVTWEMEALKETAGILGAIQGIPLSAKKPSNLQTAVSTALSVGPQVGIGIGNATGSPAIGLLAGSLAALFSYSSNIRG